MVEPGHGCIQAAAAKSDHSSTATVYSCNPIHVFTNRNPKKNLKQTRSDEFKDFTARHTIDLCLCKMLHILAYDGRGAALVPMSIRHLVQRSTVQSVFRDLLNVRLLLRVLCGLFGVCHNSGFFVGSLNHHVHFNRPIMRINLGPYKKTRFR